MRHLLVRFADGKEQRYREYSKAIRRWVVRLDLLDEGEMARLEEFFLSQKGSAGSFAFVDPWDGTRYPDCSLENEDLTLEFADEASGRMTLVVKENKN